MTRYRRADFTRIRTIPIGGRPSKVKPEQFARPFNQHRDSFRAFVAGLPDILKARDLRALVNDIHTDTLIQAAFNAGKPFRVRDVRKYASASKLEIGHSSLRSMLAIPIRWNNLNIGAILAFGKQNEVFFSENDESLAELLATQAAGAFESTWLQQEVRSSLRTTSLLYRLSTQIAAGRDHRDSH